MNRVLGYSLSPTVSNIAAVAFTMRKSAGLFSWNNSVTSYARSLIDQFPTTRLASCVYNVHTDGTVVVAKINPPI